MRGSNKTYRIKRNNGLWEDVPNIATVSHMNDGWIAFKDEAGVTSFCISSYDCLWYKLLTPQLDLDEAT